MVEEKLPVIHVPLKRAGGGSFTKMSSNEGLKPLIRGPSSGGDTKIILKTIKPKTATITNRAMKMPLQFRSFGELTTNSYKEISIILIRDVCGQLAVGD